MKFRIIPRLEVKNNFLIKGMRMEGLKKLGSPIQFAKKYSDNNFHEIFFEDVVASLYDRKIDVDLVRQVSTNINIPLIVAGGIKSINDIETLFKNGADKICINSAAVRNPKLITEASKIFGSQSISIIAQFKMIDDKYEIFLESGRERVFKDLFKWVKEAEDRGAGEIFLISIDNDGVEKDLDYNLLNQVRSISNLPLLYGGGLKHDSQIDYLKKIQFDGAIISNSLHNNKINFVKKYL
jgi:imidazole glycerol-phosphate synthase subunit HisF